MIRGQKKWEKSSKEVAITHGVPADWFITVTKMITWLKVKVKVVAGTAGGDVVSVVKVVETQGAGHDLWWEQRQDLDED